MSYKRIISLVPSLTELLIDLGLESQLVGKTRFCIYPEHIISTIPSVGGTKNPDIDKILQLEPDLIISNKEENRKSDIEELSKHTEVVVTEIDTIQQALEWISKLGIHLDVSEKAESMTSEIRQLLPERNSLASKTAAYFIWKDPWMTIGHDTYIHDVMAAYQLDNVYSPQVRYPETDFEELKQLNPEVILLSTEPYPFKEIHLKTLQQICPDSNIILVNGEWFSWYGSRMIPAFKALNNWRPKLNRE